MTQTTDGIDAGALGLDATLSPLYWCTHMLVSQAHFFIIILDWQCVATCIYIYLLLFIYNKGGKW